MESTGRSSDSFIYYFIRSFYHQIQTIDEYNSSSAQRSSMLSDLYHLNFVIFFSLRTSLYWCSILHSIKRLLCGNEVGSNSNDWKKTSQAKEHKGMEQPEKKNIYLTDYSNCSGQCWIYAYINSLWIQNEQCFIWIWCWCCCCRNIFSIHNQISEYVRWLFILDRARVCVCVRAFLFFCYSMH